MSNEEKKTYKVEKLQPKSKRVIVKATIHKNKQKEKNSNASVQ